MIKFSRNTDLIIIHDLMFDVNIVIDTGNSIISTSKIMKITGIKKNRDEKSSLAEFLGRNHIRMEIFFSRSSLIFSEISVVSIIMAVDNKMITIGVVIIFYNYLWDTAGSFVKTMTVHTYTMFIMSQSPTEVRV